MCLLYECALARYDKGVERKQQAHRARKTNLEVHDYEQDRRPHPRPGQGPRGSLQQNGITLYAYQTRDAIDNEVFVLAKNGRGVVIELPCFHDNIRELTDFLTREGIAVEGKLVAYHAAGASFLPGVPAYGTASSVAYNTNGGGAGLVANFQKALARCLTRACALWTT